MKSYFINMHYSNSRPDRYITCEEDYEDVLKAGLNPDVNYKFDSLEEAQEVKEEVEAYAREKGDDFTTFGIEIFDFERDMEECDAE